MFNEISKVQWRFTELLKKIVLCCQLGLRGMKTRRNKKRLLASPDFLAGSRLLKLLNCSMGDTFSWKRKEIRWNQELQKLDLWAGIIIPSPLKSNQECPFAQLDFRTAFNRKVGSQLPFSHLLNHAVCICYSQAWASPPDVGSQWRCTVSQIHRWQEIGAQQLCSMDYI